MRLMHGDCLERLAEVEDNSVDLILCDLPYGTTSCKWDSIIPLGPLWAQYARVLKRARAVVLTASQPFTTKLVMSRPNWFRYEWIWRKNTATGFLDANRRPLKNHEAILVFCEKAAPYHPQGVVSETRRVRRNSSSEIYGDHHRKEFDQTGKNFPRSVLDFDSSKAVGHPTAKPVPMFEYLIRTYSVPGDLVLDNAMGSGTTGVACVNEGREFIGIERDPGYFALAGRRIEEARRQIRGNQCSA